MPNPCHAVYCKLSEMAYGLRMTFEHRHLRAFVAVSDKGTIGKAAAALHSTQPTISRQIQLLEGQIEQPLFERTTKGMALTAAGEELLPRAKLILHEMELACEAIDELRGLKRGSVRVGAVAAVARRYLPRVFSEVFRQAPNLSLEVIEASEDQLEIALARREVDLIFMSRQPRGVDAVEVGEHSYVDTCVPFCSQSWAAPTECNVVDPKTLARLPWAVPQKGSTPRMDLEAICKSKGFAIQYIAFECNPADAIFDFVLRSRVIGWLPLPMLRESADRDDIRILEYPDLFLERRFQPYRRSRGSGTNPARVFLQAMTRLA